MFKVNYKKLLKCFLLTILILVISSFSLLSFSPNIFAKDDKTSENIDKEDKTSENIDKEDKTSEKKDKDENTDVELKNKTPKAQITYSLTETNLVNFDGSGSTDEDGTIVSYSWDFGDGSKWKWHQYITHIQCYGKV